MSGKKIIRGLEQAQSYAELDAENSCLRAAIDILETALNNVRHISFTYRLPPQGMTHSRATHIAITSFREAATKHAQRAIGDARSFVPPRKRRVIEPSVSDGSPAGVKTDEGLIEDDSASDA